MIHRLHAITGILLAALLVAAFASDTTAQSRETADVTFRLIIYGDPPEGEYHDFIAEDPESATDAPTPRDPFCGENIPPLGPRCEGSDEGTVYTQTIGWTVSSRLRFLYHRSNPGELGIDNFASGELTVEGDTTITAYYDYRTGQGGLGSGPGQQDDDQQTDDQQGGSQPGQLPDTGGGGMASGGLPVGSIASTALLLLAGVYLGFRRR